MVKGIIFDMGGPLVQTNPNYIYDEIAEIAEGIRMQNHFVNDEKFIQALKENNITKKYKIENIAEKIVSKYSKIPEIWDDLLPKLKRKYKLAIINNGPAITIPYFKKENNFDEFFPIFVNSSEVGIEKPGSRIYLMALRLMELKAEECIFIDDLMINVLGAEKVGIKGILFTNYENLINDLKSLNIL